VNIYLVGFRCTGKTSVGRLLARRLDWALVDTDDLVAARAGKDISEIVAQSGWPAFRDLERRVLRQVADGRRQVVATGGGAPCDEENRRFMAQSGIVVWLRAAPEVIEQRLAADNKSTLQRPALGGLDAVSEVGRILSQREPLYRPAAHFCVDTDNRSTEAVATTVLKEIEKIERLT
jgi:shikimate kinase